MKFVVVIFYYFVYVYGSDYDFLKDSEHQSYISSQNSAISVCSQMSVSSGKTFYVSVGYDCSDKKSFVTTQPFYSDLSIYFVKFVFDLRHKIETSKNVEGISTIYISTSRNPYTFDNKGLFHRISIVGIHPPALPKSPVIRDLFASGEISCIFIVGDFVKVLEKKEIRKAIDFSRKYYGVCLKTAKEPFGQDNKSIIVMSDD